MIQQLRHEFKRTQITIQYWVLIWFMLVPKITSGQSYTFYQDVEPILKRKCFNCHSKGKNYFLFDNYNALRRHSSMIKFVVENAYMPPWPADDSYQTYKHSRALKSTDKEILLSWLSGDMKAGEQEKGKKEHSLKEPLSNMLTLNMNPVELPRNEKDTFLKFSIPFSFGKQQAINRIVFSSKVLRVIHHINLFITGEDRTLKNPSFVYGYVPGIEQEEFADGQGFYLPQSGIASGDIHIPPISNKIVLDLKLLLQISKLELKHQLVFLGTTGLTLTNMEQLVIPHDSLITVRGTMPIQKDVILTHIVPHMHLLGNSITVWCEDKNGKVTPLVKIKRWEFNWQNFYEFDHPLLITAGSTIHVEAVYDNTVNNKSNPNSPPKDVTEGWYTSQEMLQVYMLAYDANE